MKNLPQILFFAAFGLFALVYGGYWAYGSLYKAPRDVLSKEIADYENANTQTEQQIKTMTEFVYTNQTYLTRSFPRSVVAVRTLYQHWLSDLAIFCDMEEPQIESYNPTQLPWCYNYRFQIRGRISSEGFARFLFEFYWAPYLHRIASITMTPIEKSDMISVDMVLEGVTLYPPPINQTYPLADQLPQGWSKRLASGPFSTYEAVASRNLLQYAKSGIDKADYTYITSISVENGNAEIWLTDRTSGTLEPMIVKLNEPIKVGSFIAMFIETDGNFVVFDRDGQRWLLESGERLSQAYAIPPEAQ